MEAPTIFTTIFTTMKSQNLQVVSAIFTRFYQHNQCFSETDQLVIKGGASTKLPIVEVEEK